MKLAEALSRRADLQKSVLQLKSRAKECAKIQEGDEPIENPDELIEKMFTHYAELEDLTFRINQANLSTMVDGVSLTKLLAEREILSNRSSSLRDILNAAVNREDRYSRNEIKYQTTIDVANYRKQLDALSQQLRLLDNKIQRVNWETDF